MAVLLAVATQHADASSKPKKKESKDKDKDKGKVDPLDTGIDLNSGFSRDQGGKHSVDRSPEAVCERHRQKLQVRAVALLPRMLPQESSRHWRILPTCL